MEKLIKEWEALAEKLNKRARENNGNYLITEKYYVMADIAYCLRNLKKDE